MPLLRVSDALAGRWEPQFPVGVPEGVRRPRGRLFTPSACWRELVGSLSPAGERRFCDPTIETGRVGKVPSDLFSHEPPLPGSDGGIQLAGGSPRPLTGSSLLAARLPAAGFLLPGAFPAPEPLARCCCWCCCSPRAGPWRSGGLGASPSPVSPPPRGGSGWRGRCGCSGGACSLWPPCPRLWVGKVAALSNGWEQRFP